MNLDRIYSVFEKTKRVFIDSRTANKGGIFFGIKGEIYDGNQFVDKALEAGASLAVTSRKELENHPNCIFVNDTISCLQKLASHHRNQLNIPIIGITGTNGKTTTKELIISVLSQQFNVLGTKGNLNNHLGVPLTILSIQPEHTIGVIEMGANHIKEIEFLCQIAQPDFGLITNIGKAHLEGFGSFEGVKRAKGELYDYLKNKNGFIFINDDNIHLNEMLGNYDQKIAYGGNENAIINGNTTSKSTNIKGDISFNGEKRLVRSQLFGKYNFENILAAAAIGFHFSIPSEKIIQGIENYVPVNNRSQIIENSKYTILVDCYNANPTSIMASIVNVLNNDNHNPVFILGDMLELGTYSQEEHQKVIDYLVCNNVNDVFLIGSNFDKTVTPPEFRKYLDIKSFLESNDQIKDQSFILLKGSRGIQLEKAIELLR